MRSVRISAAARDAARLIAVVVLPTPPFWFEIAITLAMMFHVERFSSFVPRGTILEEEWSELVQLNNTHDGIALRHRNS